MICSLLSMMEAFVQTRVLDSDTNIDRDQQDSAIDNQLGHKDLQVMSRRGKSTIARMRGSLAHMMLWMCVGLTLGGCMGPSTRTRPSSLRSVPSNRHPTTVTSASNQPVRVAAESELGSEDAANIPEA